MTKTLFQAVLAALLLTGGPASAAAAQSTPAASPESLRAGITRLTDASYVYRPKQVVGPAAVVILLHGAGDKADRFLSEFTNLADRRGVLLLALESKGTSWPRRAGEVTSGPDAANFETAIAELSAKTAVDHERLVLLGFSDGASHALSFGLAKPKTFRAIVAMSPGYAFAPRRPDPRQPIFIAHGRRDPVLPAENVREMIKGLESVGYRPEIRWFNGGHRIDPDLLKAAVDFALPRLTQTPR